KLRSVFSARLAVVSDLPSLTCRSRKRLHVLRSDGLNACARALLANMCQEIVHKAGVANECRFAGRDFLRAQPVSRVICERLHADRAIAAQLANLVENFSRLLLREVARRCLARCTFHPQTKFHCRVTILQLRRFETTLAVGQRESTVKEWRFPARVFVNGSH